MKQRGQSRRQSRRMALCGMMTALSVVILSLGSLVPLATFACPLLAMLCLIPVEYGYGTGSVFMVYGAVSVLALLLCPDKEIALFYVFLGWYPGIRADLDGLPQAARIVVKCALFTLAMAAMYGLMLYLLRLEAVMEEFAEYSTAMVVVLLVLGNLMFLIFDRALARIACLYQRKQGA